MKEGILPWCLLVYNTLAIIFVFLINDSNLLKWNVIKKITELFLSMVLKLCKYSHLLKRKAGIERS